MKRILFLMMFISMTLELAAQGEGGDHWYFGVHAGMRFVGDDIEILNDGQMNTGEGCATISDAWGNLLFYTDGISVWNAQHAIMPNGFGLLGHPSSTQSGIIVKKPQSNTIYYVFTIEDLLTEIGFHYSVVDMELENGLGDVIQDEKNVPVLTPTTEKITAIPHQNGVDFWIVTLERDGPDFYAYLLDENGLSDEPVISSVAAVFSPTDFNSNNVGYIKASPVGDRVACAYWAGNESFIELFDFNDETGELSNPMQLDMDLAYGLEFSIEGNLLYAQAWNSEMTIYQYNLEAGDEEAINDTKYVFTDLTNTNLIGALQMGPDGRIYVAKGYTNYLHRINNPSVIGEGCDVELDAVYLGSGQCTNGLPTFFSSIFSQINIAVDNTCIGDVTSLYSNAINFDSLYWDLGDGPNSIYYSDSVGHQFSDTGSYEVLLIGYKEGEADSNHYSVEIFPYPVIEIGDEMEICEHQSLILGQEFEDETATYIWQDSTTSALYTATSVGDYWVEVTVNGCAASDDITLVHCDAWIIYPNIFTPNADGFNDRFLPVNHGNVASSDLKIFDRWGRLKFETTSLDLGWDGRFNDSEASDGVYFYVVDYVGDNGKSHQGRGSFTLTREKVR